MLKKYNLRKTMSIVYVLYEFRTLIKYVSNEDIIKNMNMVSAKCDLQKFKSKVFTCWIPDKKMKIIYAHV